MKGRYGVTPWGSWFTGVLDSYRIGTRLSRGKTYAGTEKVLSLEINAGRVTAEVEGKRRPFYTVEIVFPPLKEKDLVYGMIEEDPFLLARIAAGEFPESFLQKLKKNGIDLIPRRWGGMKRSCTCPDGGDPCKHMAALYYIIAKETDADPHVLFRLRGMDLAARFGKAAVHRIAPPFTVTPAVKEKAPPGGKAGAAADEPFPEEDAGLPFWDRVLEEIPQCADLISSLLPPAPPFCTRDFAAAMSGFYRRCARYHAGETAEPGGRPLAEREHVFSRSAWTVICPDPVPGAEPVLQAEDINGNKKRYSLREASGQFVHFSSEDGTASYSFLFYLFKFLNLVCSSGAFIPYILVEKETLRIIWRPFETLPPVARMLEALALRGSGMMNTGGRELSGRSAADLLASAFLNGWVRDRFFQFKGSGRGSSAGSSGIKTGDSGYRKLLYLFFAGAETGVSSPAQRSLPSAIDRWLSVLRIDFKAHRYSITIHESARPAETGGAAAELDFTFSMDSITEQEGGIVRTPISKCRNLEILRAPIALSNYLPEIRELAGDSASGPKETVRIPESRLVSFLGSAVPLLTRLGIGIVLPKTLHRLLKPRLVVKAKSSGGALVHYLDLETMLDFEWQVAVGGEILTAGEFEKLLTQKRALVRFRDGFIKLDPDEFYRLLKRAKAKPPDVNGFLKAYFSGETVLDGGIRETTGRLFTERDFPVPEALAAELRPYQKRGYNWICSLLYSGFGCILADDMGLGKTVQSTAALLRLKEEGLLSGGCLIVAPAALLGNWEKELGRFAPSLAVSKYHGSRRRLDRTGDVFLTTYQTAARDAEKLKQETFSMLLVDEAHLMKNAGARISRAVKQIRSRYRLALSGTPVENRLEDLRSLFDFILPGYLGSAESFRKLYRIPIEVMRSHEQAEALRKITSPFLLRRVKTDKQITGELPEKTILNGYAALTKTQAVLYESVVAESMRKSEKSSSGDRAPLILSLLTSLKQICNHPRVFDKESPAVSALSGKAQLLITLLEEILANRGKTLIYSQYVETLECLDEIIRKELGEAPLIYHGGLGQNTRQDIISRFQDDPAARILLVSLKAGGLGLNLTAASHVIHYDLWYNPAVENQATDRAFRIGQKRSVFVHRFITKNSFEEKIDAMIAGKRELADMTVASGESWLARMSHAELQALFGK